ncbi:hypothetical protein ColLi_04800 [Colletotrichum liriopes]|uniref:Uncharacterized protein n=1 Tax=Colletotrichum liriopes TaxID=708192 RepID=A0AA37GK86_9PEZI|nr:hypothetical protein ColLi_04800 [Colletotrichum liriopes]
MPSPTSYRSADPPGSPGNDSDSDLDLDIQELDPATTSTERSSGLIRHDRQNNEHRSPRIALRNLRMGAHAGLGRRPGDMENSVRTAMAPARMPKHFSANPKALLRGIGTGTQVQAPTMIHLSSLAAHLPGAAPSPETDSSA